MRAAGYSQAAPRTVLHRGVAVPRFHYGTAWKEDRTRDLVRRALEAGFRGIDTANQRRHYHEAQVGDALREALASGAVARDDLFVQTKFTHRDGQDHRLPYDEFAPVEEQVRQSLASSLEHLGLDRVDSLLLHGPTLRRGLAPEDVAAWRAIQALHAEGKARLVGASNVALDQLEALLRLGDEPPAFVQNRCYASTGWDREVRALCRAEGILYQGFSLLTANRREVAGPVVAEVAARTGLTPAQVVFRFALEVGMIPLTGTTSALHMAEDLAVLDRALGPEDIARIESLAG